MAEPFLAEIRIFSFNFAPKGWAQCNGQTMPINQNQALYALLSTKFGGDGKTTFGIPNLQGRVAVNPGPNNVAWGTSGGEVTHTLTSSEMPAHNHAVVASLSAAAQRGPSGGYWSVVSDTTNNYAPMPNTTMAAAAVTTVGGGQAHPNMQPYLVLNYCIAITGYFPPHP